MSEKNNSRTRRRASRSAGPPVDEVRNEALSASDPDRSDAVEPGTAVPGSAHVRGQEPDKTDTRPVAEAGAADADRPGADTAKTDPATVEPDADTVKLNTASAQTDADTVKLDKASSGPADPSSADDKPRRSPARILAVAASTILALALVAGAVISVFAMRSTEERDALRAEYIQTARQTVLNLTTIRADTAKEDIDRILTMASGEFKDEFNGRVDPFTEVVKQAKVQSTGEVVEAALESSDDNSARVLVAAKQTVTNAGQEGPQLRYYRFRITVTNSDSGMTASDVEFVA
ncbi:hypothetical protein IU438_15930 [Nocardia cyriacigeorgica]|uniref:hypothetical protein n=1 Tax=Nocardia cyriacigeorgica TaxID=135487 RepID=UPI001893767A|nr:hypothetical protein [Nocardia cyriacigeorgica]MBF6087367.1 hypothetical protein [Nocardia cyriacigeorgica]MBF6092703.1 hypothetical protein [Nocardia cyriacigeorgica]MBF6397280.1 hypothetical protein [Nocardia cyriacigeorgica]MBF6403062.1 hypothetical protein [Nocardia cyriacigeorgica]